MTEGLGKALDPHGSNKVMLILVSSSMRIRAIIPCAFIVVTVFQYSKSCSNPLSTDPDSFFDDLHSIGKWLLNGLDSIIKSGDFFFDVYVI